MIRLLSPYEDLFDDLISNAPTEELVVVFKAVRELSIRENIDDIDSRLESSVKTAFFMVASGEIETVRKMLDTFNIDKVSISGKVERLVYFLARPVVACRHFAKVARTLPHFANIKVIHRQPPAGIQLDTKHVVSLDHAWQQLQLPQFANQEKFMKKFSQRFREDCSRELRVHTEVQLLQLYEAHAHLVPTTKYLGCSKKACLLCETALSQSTLGLVAGKRHGKLYPVWAVPRDALPHFGQRLSELADMIVQRIRLLQTRETEFLEGAIVESTIISDLRSKDLAEIRQRQDFVKTTTSTAEETRLNTALLYVLLWVDFSKLNFHRNRPNTLAQPSGSQATRSRSTWTHKYNELEECVICANRPSTLAQCCESVRYCSDNCRKVDKPGHDLLCEQLQKLDPRPSPIHVRAILLPQDEPKPRWIWVECEQMVEDDGERWEMAQVRPFLGPDKPHIGTTYIQRNAKRCYNLADTIQIQYRDNFLTDGSRANRSLSAALGQLSSMPYKWRGPIVAIRAIGTSDMNRHRDMTLMDLRQTLDLFSSYDDETVVPVESPTITSPSGTTQQPQRSAGHVWGVQVNCTGERRLHGVDEYVAVQIPPHHPTQRPLYPDGDVPSISVLVGLPVRAWRIRDDNAYESRDWKEEGLHYDNRSITFLFQQADPHDQSWGWGWAPPKWNLDTGNVILVKDGGGDLSVREASMLWGFCRDELLDWVEAAREPEGPLTEEWVGRVMGYITRESFGEYMKKRDREDEDDYDYADDDSGDWDYEEMENWGRRR